MMYGHEKSDPAIVAVKPANKAERSAAELAERRVGTKGNAGQLSTRRTQSRVSVSQVLARIRHITAVDTRGGRSYGAGRRRWGCPAFLLNIEKRSLPRLMLSGDGLASNEAV
jgi:hypothetical protein